MKKKGWTKIGIVALVVTVLALFILTMSQSLSFSGIQARAYKPGDFIQFDFTNQAYRIKIITPTTSYAREGQNDKFSFKLVEQGAYSFVVSINNKTNTYGIFVGTQEQATGNVIDQNNSSDNQSNLDNLFSNSVNEGSVSSFQSQELFVINQPVRWRVNISLGSETIKIPKRSFNISTQNGTYIEYYTEGPKSREKVVSNSEKEVRIYADDGVNYTNIIAYTNITRAVYNKNNIKVYWKEQGQYLDFQTYQGEDGKIENISWIVPDSNNQTFEIILVTKAAHLDSNREFLDDVYDKVKEKDGIYAIIPDKHYLRVTFERKLTNKNDITIYARSNSSGRIKVYESGSGIELADFGLITDDKMYRILLTNLSNEQDTFDLQVSGNIDFDYVVDPTFFTQVSVQRGVLSMTATTANVVLSSTNRSNSFVLLRTRSTSSTPNILHVTGNISSTTNLYLQKNSATATTVEWEVASADNFNVQEGQYAAAAFTQTAMIDLHDGVNLSRSFILINGRMNSATAANLVRDLWTAQFMNSTRINITRGVTGTAANVDWQVVDWEGASVINGTVDIGTNPVTVNLPSSINASNTFLILSAYSTNTNARNATVQGIIANPTQLVFDIMGTTPATPPIRASYFLISSPAISVQNGTTALTSAAVFTANINAVNMSRTFLTASYNYGTSSTTWANVYSTWNLTSATQLRFQKGGATGTANVAWFAVELIDVRDLIAPDVTLISPINGTNSSSSTFSFNATFDDPYGKMKNATLFIWNTTAIVNQTNGTISGADDSENISVILPRNGDYFWNYFACDQFSNCNWSIANFTLDYDSIPPKINITYPLNKTYNTNVSQLNYTRSDLNLAYCWYSRDDGATNSSPSASCSNFTNVLSVEGSNTWTLYANDSVGNLNKTNVTFFKDTIAPNISIVYPQNTTYTINVSTFNYTCTNGAYAWYSTNGGATNSTTNPCGTNFSNVASIEGSNTWILYANDSFGNLNKTNVTFFKDTIHPQIQYGSKTETSNTNLSRSNIVINVTATDTNLANITIRLYNSSYQLVKNTTTPSSPNFINYTGLADGLYYFNATAYDTLANDNSTVTYNVTLDTTPPAINITYPLNKTYTINVSTFNYTCTNGAYAWYSTNGGATNSTTNPCGTNFSNVASIEGSNTWILYANDSFGNLNKTNVTFYIRYPPNISLFNSTGGIINSTTNILNDYNNDIYDLDIVLDNQVASHLYIYGFNKSGNLSLIFSSQTNENWGNKSFAVSTDGMLFNSMNISLVANGSYVYKCSDWNMPSLSCNNVDSWDVVLVATEGQPYNLTINSSDPGFVELSSGVTGDVLMDGYANQASPSTEWGARTVMYVANYSGSNMHSMVKFNITKIPAGVVIDSANLTLRCSTETLDSGDALGVGAYQVYPSFAWTEGTGGNFGNACTGSEFCWNNRPSAAQYNTTPDYTLSIPDGCAGFNYTFSVTSAVKSAYSQGFNNVSLYIVPTGANIGTVTNDYVAFSTRQFSPSSLGPKLNITYHSVPRVTAVLPANGSNYNYSTNVTIRANVSDVLVNISRVIANVTLPNGTIEQLVLTNISGITYEVNFTHLSLIGRYNVTIIANNTDGYVNSSEGTWFFGVDSIKPQINFTNPTENSASIKSKTNISVNVTATDDFLANITIRLYNSSALVNASNSSYSPYYLSFVNLNDGIYYFNATACDGSANCNTTETRNVTIDTTSPGINITYPLNTSYNINVSRLNYTCTNGAYAWYSTNGGATNSTTNPCGTNFSNVISTEGSNTWILYANDSVGNLNSTNVTFSKDTIKPQIEFTPPTEYNDSNITRRNIVVNVSASDLNLANITIYLYNAVGLLSNITTLNSPNYVNFTSLADGTYWFNASAYDLFNNVNYTLTYIVRISTTIPFALIEYPQNVSYDINVTQLNYTCSVSGYARYSTNMGVTNSSSQTCGNNFTNVISTEGSNTWILFINDSFGNSNSTNITFYKDTLAPQIQYGTNTEQNGSIKSRNWIFVNVSVIEPNEANITFNLYNLTGIVNSTMFTNKQRTINWTTLIDGEYYYNVTVFDYALHSNSTLTNTITLETSVPEINYGNLTEESGTTFERNWIFVNVSVIEPNEANITFNLYNLTGIVNSTMFTNKQRTINWTNLPVGNYTYFVKIFDTAGNTNQTTNRTLRLVMVPPYVSLIYPEMYLNLSSSIITNFSFIPNDENEISNCSLYGDWSGTFEINQTLQNPVRGEINNFSSVVVSDDRYYVWNVECYDAYGNFGQNNSNFTFAVFLPPLWPVITNITQTSNDGQGNVAIYWSPAQHAVVYNVYYSNNMRNFVLLNQTTALNYTDSAFAGNLRRFYYVSSWNPVAENSSTQFASAHVYTLGQNVNTRNWIGLPTNATYLNTANDSLYEIRNITAVTMWNSTTQRASTCNTFSCPNFPSCTDTNCNFGLSQGAGYEVNLNTSAPSLVNWSLVGLVYTPINLTLTKNDTSYGKNWIAIYANTSLVNAQSVMGNISKADAFTHWNAVLQKSEGLIPSPFPFGPRYIGTNFNLTIESGYELSVNQTMNWTQM